MPNRGNAGFKYPNCSLATNSIFKRWFRYAENALVNIEAASLREAAGESLLLSNEGCGLCATCTWPDAPCRLPHKMAHSIEGYGLSVPQLAEAAGMRYSNGPNTVTFFGAILYRE